MDARLDTILLVEDNEDDVFLMIRALKRARIVNPLEVLTDGQQAIDYLSGTGPYADRVRFPFPLVMFLDLQMPRKSGFDVLAWMETRRDRTGPIVVVLSSSNAPRDMETVGKFGATYAVKPPDEELFRHLASEFNFRWRAT